MNNYVTAVDVTAAIVVGDFTFKGKREAAGTHLGAGRYNIRPTGIIINTASTQAVKQVVVTLEGSGITQFTLNLMSNVIHEGLYISGFIKTGTTTDNIVVLGVPL